MDEDRAHCAQNLATGNNADNEDGKSDATCYDGENVLVASDIIDQHPQENVESVSQSI